MATTVRPSGGTLNPASATATRGGTPAATRATERRDRAVVTLLLLAVAALANWNSAHKSLWTDEAYTLTTVGHSLAGTLSQSLHFELQPPVYFVLLHLWMALGGGIGVARIVSTICIVGFVAICYAIGRLLRLPWPPALAILAAVTPTVIWAASEARNYPLTLLLAGATLYCFLRLMLAPPSRPAALTAAYAALAALSVGTFYYSAFLLFGQWVAALVVRRQRWRVTLALAAAGVLCLPLVPIALGQWRLHPIDAPRAVAAHPTLSASVYMALATIDKGFVGDTMVFRAPHVVPAIAVALLCVVAARLAVRSGRWHVDEQILLIAAAVPTVVLGALFADLLIPIHSRHSMVLVPVVLTLNAVLLTRIVPRGLGWVVGSCFVGALVANVVYFEMREVNTEDWRGAAAYVETQATADDRVVVFDPDRVLPFRYYYHGAAPLSALPVDPDLERYRPINYAVHDTATVTARFAAIGVRDRVWLVEADRLLPDLVASRGVITEATDQCCRVASRRHFHNVTVMELDVR
ncbi:MAG TPA: hypothetical protein VNW46_15645 [Gemmatimonadaceae bacterium]|nr:hypothetical protein [Gemmatimonadaceae bacterium]